MSESRYFANNFADFDPEKQHEVPRNDAKLGAHLNTLIEKIEESIEDGSFPLDDSSVYTGLSGVALLHYFLWRKTGNADSLKRADYFLRKCDANRAGKRFTFLCGDAGPLSLAAVIAEKLGQKARMEDSLRKLQEILPRALENENDELLFGRSGYLYALLFTRHELHQEEDSTLFLNEIEAVCGRILDSGRELAGSLQNGPPLMWQWHEKMYLGAAHGVAGIIHTLLLAYPISQRVKASLLNEIEPTLAWLTGQRYSSSGNWFSSLGSSSGDKLVQWCHGAAAMTHVFLKFHEISPKKEFLKAALDACDVVWQRGLLTKGYGICHGAAGNAYSFLGAYKASGDPRHLHRASKFAEFCTEKRKIARNPDRPFSLFEGSAGTAWFLADLCLSPDLKMTSFPAYELIPK